MKHPVLSSQAVGNVADGNAIQQNGDTVENQVFRTIYNDVTVGTLCVNGYAGLSNGLIWPGLVGNNIMLSVKSTPKRATGRICAPQPVGEERRGKFDYAGSAATLILPEQGPPRMLLYPNQIDSRSVCARVSFDHAVRGNWIRKAILRRLREFNGDTAKEQRDSVVRHGVHSGKTFQSNGAFVDFIYRGEHQDQQKPHRFYVLDHADFDVLIGTGSKLPTRLLKKV